MKPQRLKPLIPTWPFTTIGAGLFSFLIFYGAGSQDWLLIAASVIGLTMAFRLLLRGL